MTSTPPPRPGPGPALLEAGGAWKGLAGFLLSGLLFSLLGVILPVWRHHLTEDYVTAGNYFLAMNLGVLVSFGLARLARGRGLSLILALACGLACGALVYLAFLSPSTRTAWRFTGIFVLGCGAGLLNLGVLRAISPLYRREPASTVNLAGAMFGIGCVLMAVLVAGTYYAYSVTGILLLIALLPAFFIPIYAKARFAGDPDGRQPSLAQAFADFRSPGAVLFALLLFFQFGNEWTVAGWLPLFLIQRLGISPESSLILLAVYWMSLLVGRVVIYAILPSVASGKVLMASVPAALFGCAMLLSTDNRFGATVGTILVGGGFASVYPWVVEKIGVRFPYYHPGFFNGIFSFALTGGMLAPWSVGLFAELWGIRVVMLLPLLGTLMVFILLMLIWAEAKFGSMSRTPGAQNRRIERLIRAAAINQLERFDGFRFAPEPEEQVTAHRALGAPVRERGFGHHVLGSLRLFALHAARISGIDARRLRPLTPRIAIVAGKTAHSVVAAKNDRPCSEFQVRVPFPIRVLDGGRHHARRVGGHVLFTVDAETEHAARDLKRARLRRIGRHLDDEVVRRDDGLLGGGNRVYRVFGRERDVACLRADGIVRRLRSRLRAVRLGARESAERQRRQARDSRHA